MSSPAPAQLPLPSPRAKRLRPSVARVVMMRATLEVVSVEISEAALVAREMEARLQTMSDPAMRECLRRHIESARAIATEQGL